MDKNRRKVMIVDDDLDILLLIKDMLESNGYEAYDFLNPIKALDAFEQNPNMYDLVLLDIMMRELDGRQVYVKMKQINPNCKVYIFTGLDIDSNEFLKICPSFKEQQLIRKPSRMDSLLKIVNDAIAMG